MHSSLNYTPFTYIIGWTSINKWYYGVRWAKLCHPSQLWTLYYTSSQYVKQLRETFGEPDVIEIRRTFTSGAAARAWEEKVIRRLGAVFDNKWVNKGNAGKNFCFFNHTESSKAKLSKLSKGAANAKDAISGRSLGKVPITDPRWASGEIVHVLKGRPHSTEHNLKKSIAHKGKPNNSMKGCANAIDSTTGRRIGRVSKSDPRWASGEIHTLRTRSATAKDAVTGICLGEVQLDDPRWKSKEIVGLAKGRTSEKKGIPSGKKGVPLGAQEIVTCPHCNKEGGRTNMTRYHFDNCRSLPNPTPKETRNRKSAKK